MSIIVFQLIGSKNTNAIGMKGRNVCNFFIFFNFAMWLTYTFERQSANSSAFESQVLGTVAWAIIQRMTLPMIIFFRFHALVFCVELRKQYKGTETLENTARSAFSPNMVAIVLWRLTHLNIRHSGTNSSRGIEDNPTENQNPGASYLNILVNGVPLESQDSDSGITNLTTGSTTGSVTGSETGSVTLAPESDHP